MTPDQPRTSGDSSVVREKGHGINGPLETQQPSCLPCTWLIQGQHFVGQSFREKINGSQSVLLEYSLHSWLIMHKVSANSLESTWHHVAVKTVNMLCWLFCIRLLY